MTAAAAPGAMPAPSDVRLYAALIALLVVLCMAALWIGDVALTPAELLSPAGAIILQDIRLPRLLLGLLMGGSLGLSGAALQGLLRNPLAEPGVVGVSATAALGAVIVFYFGITSVFPLALPLAGFAGGAVAVALLYALAGRGASAVTLILAGIAIANFSSALTALALNLAPSPYAALEIAFWLLGSLADRSMADVALIAAPVLIGWVLLASTGRALDALTLGDATAQSLGVSLGGLRLRVILGTALAVGASVSVAGSIAFVGLVVPHLLRPFVGHEPGRLLLPSALGGASLLIASDIAARLIPTGTELRPGVITALIGVPFFFALVLAQRRVQP